VISARLADILERFDGARRDASGGFMARCPAHDDGRPSLHLNEGERGGVAMHCFAGCANEDITKAVGLTMADLMPPATESRRTGGRLMCSYEYQDAEGHRLFETVRFEPKDFRQRRLSDGKWTLEGVERVLYHLPEVLIAAKGGRTVWVTEGEKDADQLILRCAVTATTNPMGAGKWRDEYAQSLLGSGMVEIVEDQDEPGRAHARAVESSLRKAGISARIRRPKAGKDAYDHLAAGHALDDMDIVAYAEESSVNGQGDVDPATLTRWSLESITAPQLLANDEPLTWLVTDILAAGMPCMIGGPFKAFKTSVLVDLAVSLTNGVPFLGKFAVPNPVPVLFVSAESGRPTVRQTLRRILKAKGEEASESLTFSFKCPKLTRPESLEAIEAELDRTGAQVLILDPFYLMLEGGTKAENLFSMGTALVGVADLCTERGVTLILAHHFNRPGVRQLDPPSLVDLTMTGVAEYARQWILLGWRSAYDAPARQGYLWLATGVAGWTGDLWELDINEGAPDCLPEDRVWTVTIRRPGDGSSDRRIADAILKYLALFYPNGRTPNMMKREAGGAKGAPNIEAVCRQMTSDDLLEDIDVTARNGQPYNGYRITAGGLSEVDALQREGGIGVLDD